MMSNQNNNLGGDREFEIVLFKLFSGDAVAAYAAMGVRSPMDALTASMGFLRPLNIVEEAMVTTILNPA